LTRFEQRGSLIDLDRAIKSNEQTVASAPNDCAAYLQSLSYALQQRFELTGSVDDLNQAIAIIEPAKELSAEAEILEVWVMALRLRFDYAGSMDDIDRANGTDGSGHGTCPVTISVEQFVSTI